MTSLKNFLNLFSTNLLVKRIFSIGWLSKISAMALPLTCDVHQVGIEIANLFPFTLVNYICYSDSHSLPLFAYFKTTCLGNCTGVSFIDSTSIDVCLNQRIASHKAFAGLAEHGRTSTGWFWGLQIVPGDQ